LREINYRLTPTVDPEVFVSKQQRSPLTINLKNKEVEFIFQKKVLKLAKDIRLIHIDPSGNEREIGQSNWSNFTVGDDGVKVHNFYPNVDLVFAVSESKIEIDFIVKQNLNLQNGNLVMRQQFGLGNDLRINSTGNGHEKNHIIDSNNTICFVVENCFAYSNDPANTPLAINSGFNSNGEFNVYTPVSWLNSSSTIYPVVIDPIVTSADSLLAASIIGTKYSPVCWTNSCDYFLTVPTPANSTVTDITGKFRFLTLGPCLGSDGGFSIELAGCSFPPGAPPVMTCLPATNFNCGYDSTSMPDLLGCIPAPSCAPQNLNFILHFYRCNTDPDTNCTGNCVRANSNWVMYVSGRTLENIFFTPGMQVCGGTNVDLVVVADFGVPPYSYAWNTSPSTNDTLRVTPNVTTIYNVTVTDQCGTNFTATDTITVEPNTNPGFTISPITACINTPINLSGNGSSVATDYDWVVPGSNAAGGVINDNQNPTVQYSLPGNYSITLRYFNANCLYFDSTIAITITSQSVPDVTVSNSVAGPFCQGDTLHFTSTSVNGGSAPTYDWIVDGVVLQSGAVDSFSTSLLNNGSVVQVVLHSNSACISSPTDTASTFIALNSSVVPDVTISPDTAVCPGSPVTYTASPSNGGTAPTYQWYVNGAAIAGATAATFTTVLNAGDSLITVEMNSNLRCVTTSSAIDTSINLQLQNSVPALNLISDAGAALCTGDTIHFTGSSVFGGNAPLYQWYVNGVASGPATSDSTFDFVVGTGIDSVSVLLTSSLPCIVTNTATGYDIVQGLISLMPAVTITTNPAVVCEGNSTDFIALAQYGGVSPTFEWFVNGQSSANGAIFSPAPLMTADSVSVEMTSNVPCALQPQVSSYYLVNNFPSPIADFTYSNPAEGAFLNEVSFLNTSIDASFWVWYFRSDSDTTFVRDPIHQFPAQGTYEVTLLVQNNLGCIDSVTYNVIVRDPLAVFLPRAFTPNGDNINEFFAPIGASLSEYEFRIFNRWGEVIFVGNEKKPWNGNVRDSATPAPEGVYVFHLEAKGLDLEDRMVNGRVTLIR
jgi:gliding motility-associated-like protein